MDKPFTLLLCDDEADILDSLRRYLELEGYEILTAGNGAQALEIIQKNVVDLMVIDVMMPVMDGITAVKHLRASGSDLPVIMLTAKSEDLDELQGLRSGANDYVTKPYNFMVLQARIERLLPSPDSVKKTTAKDVLRNGGLEMNTRSRSVSVDGREVHLTPLEYGILHLFMTHPGQVFSLVHIFRAVKNEEPYGAENTIAVHIRHLREKIEIDPAHPEYIRVKFGQGYWMEER